MTEDKLARLEEQMRKLIGDFKGLWEKNESIRRQNEQLLSELLEKTRQIEVLEERGSMLMETQAEKKKLEQQRELIRRQVQELLEKVRTLRGIDKK
jgi:chromosome segregation ATPase